MKTRLFLLLIPSLALASCLKNNKTQCVPTEVTYKAPDPEITSLQGFLSGNGITATADPRGFFYTISDSGTGTKPNTCSTIIMDYTAKLLSNRATVDSNNNVQYPVNAFILGWQEALPLLAAGGSMTLYVPPSLAYGSQVNGNIPANSNLVFTIKLKAVQ